MEAAQEKLISQHKNIRISRRLVTLDATGGEWVHAEGVDYIFYYIQPYWNDSLRLKVALAFQDALLQYPAIKEAVKKVSGQEVLDGFYTQDVKQVTAAMSTIKGMAQTGSINTNLSGENTATNITTDFFANVLATVNPNVGPIQDYLLSTMSKIQKQSQAQKSETAGIIIAMISVVTGLDIVMTTFVHVVTTQQTEFN
jgi:hypothetical protein